MKCRWYDVRLTKTIVVGWELSRGDHHLYRDVGLPFPPFVGLVIRDGEFEAVIKHVCWDVKAYRFEACTACERIADAPLDYWLGEGWKLQEKESNGS